MIARLRFMPKLMFTTVGTLIALTFLLSPVACDGEVDPFSGMSTEQIRAVIKPVFKKIDIDGDKKLDEEELTKWAKQYKEQSAKKHTLERWQELGIHQDDKLSWEKYRVATFGIDNNYQGESHDRDLFNQLTERDRYKWDLADTDKDGDLTFSEFAAFLYPENFDHMHDTIISATLNDMDSNKDGQVSEAEFIGEAPSMDTNDFAAGSGGKEQSWVVEQRRQFREVLDTNGDGSLDFDEVRAWMNPLGFSAIGVESKHVLYMCDADHDRTLSLNEILDNAAVFARSMLTDYGSALRSHDEL